MSRRKNKFIREKLPKQNATSAQGKKGKKYRTELEPFLGATVHIRCASFTLKRATIDGKPCIQVLLQEPQIIKVPSHLSNLDLPATSHLWITLDTAWESDLQNAEYLWLRGFLYEYVHCGYRNIGFQVLQGKIYSSKAKKASIAQRRKL